MSGFPLNWGDDLGPPPDNGWPVSAQAIAAYLEGCAYHFRDDEPPLTFGPPALVLHSVVEQRGFWIWTCTDRDGVTWFVVASLGPATITPDRWIFAETRDGRTPEEMLQHTLDEMHSTRPSP